MSSSTKIKPVLPWKLALIHYAGWLTCDKGRDENSWSDRKHLPKGKITALQFKADSDWVCQVRARYVYLIYDFYKDNAYNLKLFQVWKTMGFMACHRPWKSQCKNLQSGFWREGQHCQHQRNMAQTWKGGQRRKHGWLDRANYFGHHIGCNTWTLWGWRGPCARHQQVRRRNPRNEIIWHRYVESPHVEGAILSHLSGSTTKGDVHLAFHWVVPATDDDDSRVYDPMSDPEEDPEEDYYVPPEYFIP